MHLSAQRGEHDSSGYFLVESHSCFSYCGVSLLCTGIFHTNFSPLVVYIEHNFRHFETNRSVCLFNKDL